MAKFSVNYRFQARACDIIEAESYDEAKAMIEDRLEDDDFTLEPDDIDDVNFDVQQLHPVTRDGREIWTTYIKTSDLRGHPSALAETPLFGAQS